MPQAQALGRYGSPGRACISASSLPRVPFRREDGSQLWEQLDLPQSLPATPIPFCVSGSVDTLLRGCSSNLSLTQ